MLLYSTRSFEQELDRACLKNAFSSSGGTVRDFDAGEPFITSDVAGVDIVICLNKKAFACAVRLFPFNKPLVYVTRSSDAISEYVNDWRLADRIVIIKDTRNVRHFYSPQGVRQVTTIMNVRRRCLPAGDSAQHGLAINFEDDF